MYKTDQNLTAQDLVDVLAAKANPIDAAFLQRYFKTGKGEYGEGDVFIGVRMPVIRAVCRDYRRMPLEEAEKLLASPVHEHRMAGVVLMSNTYGKADNTDKERVYEAYINALKNGRVNNWDLVDLSCIRIVGEHLRHNRKALEGFARSQNLWERRVAIISTFAYLKDGDAQTTLLLAEILINDKQDLIHKAVGWALREVGQRANMNLLTEFLDRHAATMPRTALRYACEKMDSRERAYYYSLGKAKR